MNKIKPLSTAIVTLLAQTESDYISARLTSLQEYNANILGVQIQKFGNATVFAIKHWPEYWYGNLVVGINKDSVSYLPQIHEFFMAKNLNYRISISPSGFSANLGKILTKYNYYIGFFSTALYYIDPVVEVSSSPISTRKVQEHELENFLDA